MAISGFGRGRDENQGASASSSGGSGMGGFGNLTAFIDQGSEFEGKLSFKDTVRIDGTFSGEITSDNTLIVGESGQIHATIKSVCVVISGLVEGDIHATEQILLHKTAHVTGDLQAPKIVMEEGAQLNGTVRMGGSAKASAGKGAAPVKGAPESAGNAPSQPAKGQNG